AANLTLGDLFVHLVLSSQGEAFLQSYGFTPILPGYSIGSKALPGLLQPETVALPAALAAEI
ncbi:MAG: hypothetical protein L3K09_07750, partial [Thermoplasmata archaeon]|nr:hypothetical protein [Thermoplasmata archaeon]